MVFQNSENDYAILQRIFHNKGFDILDYSLPHIQRRINGRMSALGISTIQDYEKYLISNKNEYTLLFNVILGKESQFFRDPEIWEYFRQFILPKILDNKSFDKEIKIWSVGCASGEEAFSLALMLFDSFGNGIDKNKIMIYATDIDESELRIARNGTYLLDQLSGLPDNLRDQYFFRQGRLYTINDDVRSIVTFGKHNVVVDPPITNIDLLLCRYVLLYLDSSLIPKALQNLRYALNSNGILWLGKGERHIDSNKYGFKPFGNKWRFFKKQSIQKHYQTLINDSDTKHFLSQEATADNIYQENYNIETGVVALNEDLEVIFFNQTAFQIFVDKNIDILNTEDSLLFTNLCQNSSMAKKDKRISFLDLNINYYIDNIQDKIKQLMDKRDCLIIDDIEHWQGENNKIYLRMIIIPLSIIDIDNKNILIILDNMTKIYEFREKTRFMVKSFETTKEKLLSTNSILERATDELEIINKYLQSRNNEEFILLNEKIIKQSMEFEILKNQYEAILDSIGLGVMIVDQNFFVRNMNSLASKYLEIDYELIVNKSLIGINNKKISYILQRISETMETGENIKFIIDSFNSEKQFLEVKINPINKPKNEGVILIIKEGVLSSC